MHECTTKFLLRFALSVGIGCLVLACDSSGPGEKSIVRNLKSTPEFVIQNRIPERDYVYFIALGDQGRGGHSQKHVAQLMNEKARKDSLHFVITVGDNFYSHGVTSASDQQWLEKFENMYDLPYLQTPFYAALGNHDHHNGNARHQVEYSKTSGKWKMPHYYYTFTKVIDAHSSIQFFALDTEGIRRRGENAIGQLEWLEHQLRASTAAWKIVYGHHPVFSYGRHGHTKQMIDLVRPLLEKYEVDVYICGHDHDRQLLDPGSGVDYVVSGTGSKSRDTRYGEMTTFAATNLGFAWFRASAGDLHVQFIDANGDIEYAHTWTKGTIAKRHDEPLQKVVQFE